MRSNDVRGFKPVPNMQSLRIMNEQCHWRETPRKGGKRNARLTADKQTEGGGGDFKRGAGIPLRGEVDYLERSGLER